MVDKSTRDWLIGLSIHNIGTACLWETLCSPAVEVEAVEAWRVCGVMYVFLSWWKESFYILVTCYKLFQCREIPWWKWENKIIWPIILCWKNLGTFFVQPWSGVELNLCGQKFKDDREVETAFDRMADSAGHGLLSTRNIETRPTIW